MNRKSYLLRLIEKDNMPYILGDILKRDEIKRNRKVKKEITAKKKDDNNDNIIRKVKKEITVKKKDDNNNDIIWDGTIITSPTTSYDSNIDNDNDNTCKKNDENDNPTATPSYDTNIDNNNEKSDNNNVEVDIGYQITPTITNEKRNLLKEKNDIASYYMKFKAINQDDIDEKDKIKLYNQSRMLAAEMAFASKDLNVIRNTKSESSSRNSSRLQSKYADITYSFSDGAQHVSTCTCEKCRKKSNKLKHKRINLNGTTKEIYVASSSDKRVIIKNNTIVNGTFKMVGNVKLVIDILECHNFIRTTNLGQFSILWSNHYIKGYCFKSLSRCQKINLFPRSWECTRKDSMARNINAMADLHGRKHFSYMPECFVLPQEREALLQAMESSRGRPWIIKPAGSSQGRGIYITSNPIELPDTYQNNKNDDNWIVERYIDNPLLVDSRKFDLRLYVVVTSYNPLKIYLHEEGLCRLATEKYANETYYDKYAHLTNYSINKHNVKDRVPNPEDVDVENESKLKGNELKLSLAELNSILEDMTINTIPIWNKIEDLIVKTLISVESKIYNALDIYSVNNESCFELFGFDVLIDANLNPFLMEVNFSPSLNTDSPLDLQVKSKVLADLFNLVGIRQSANSLNPSKNDSSFALTDNTIDGIISELKLFDIDLQGDKGLRALNIFIKEMERANEGGYKLIFPITSQGQGEHISSMLKYNNFFEKERSLNKLLAQYIFATSLQQNKRKLSPEKETKKSSLTANRLKEHLSNSKDFNSLWARASGRSVR